MPYCLRLITALVFSLVPLAPIAAQTTLTGNIKHQSAYFLKSQRLRHHRYQLMLKQNSTVTPTLNSVVEGRFRFDAALYPGAPQADLPRSVRDDEMLEAEARQVYLDYLSDYFSSKIGIQQIDWVDSLSPRTSDTLTAIDLRYGGNGSSQDILEPVFAQA